MNIALGVRPYIGVTKDIGRGLFSAIDKRPVTEPLWLSPIGLAGDEQADTRVHGGPERAVHHYAQIRALLAERFAADEGFSLRIERRHERQRILEQGPHGIRVLGIGYRLEAIDHDD